MDTIERAIIAAVDENRSALIAFAKDVGAHGEAGFFEDRTAKKAAEFLAGLGLTVKTGLAKTGLKAVLNEEKPRVAIIAELDGILCPKHPFANPENGISHACGHNLQLCAMLGAAAALSMPEVSAALDGSVEFLAVPAEEYVASRIRKTLKETDDIQFCSGKSELLRRGEFDDVDIALTDHVHMIPCDKYLLAGNVACNGFVCKTVRIHGKALHAATAPFDGINALNAAALAISAIGMLRETFREEDTIRVHTNLIDGGKALNVVPDLAVVELQIRANNIAALDKVCADIDRVFNGCASALGATAEIITEQGYMPVRPMAASEATLKAAETLGIKSVKCQSPEMRNMASTDVGDLTQVLPVINYTHGGVCGSLHSADFAVTDEEMAYIMPAKLFALSAYYLLKDGAQLAKKTIADFEPAMTTQQYVDKVKEQM